MFPFEEGAVNLNALLVILVNVFAYMLISYLWLGKSKENRGNIFLSLIILQSSFYVLPDFLILTGLINYFPHAVRIYVIGSFLLGPITYFYVRTCTQKDFRVTKKMWFHFIPAVLDFIYQLPFYMLKGDEKIPYAFNFYLEGSFQQPLWLTLIKLGHMAIYYFISIRIINRYRKHLPDTVSSYDNAFHRWLYWFCFVLITPIISSLIFIFINPDFSATFFNLSLFMVIITALSLLVIKPTLFHHFPHQMSELETAEIQKQKYENSNLQEVQKEKLLQQLLNHFEEKKPYLAPELSVKEISEQTQIPSHYLSQIINEKMNCTFLDFVNSYRVEEAKKLLANDNTKQYTILSIAYEAGFNSKSTFYSAFKKHVGTTPSGFRKSLT